MWWITLIDLRILKNPCIPGEHRQNTLRHKPQQDPLWSTSQNSGNKSRKRFKKKKKTVSDKLFIMKLKLRFWMCLTNQGQKLEGSHLFVASKKKSDSQKQEESGCQAMWDGRSGEMLIKGYNLSAIGWMRSEDPVQGIVTLANDTVLYGWGLLGGWNLHVTIFLKTRIDMWGDRWIH